MLTFEADLPGVIEINFDSEGRRELLEVISRLTPGDHEHVFAPSWGGEQAPHQLTEDFPNPDLAPIFKVTFQFVEG